mmetsp:Transcript_55728/g.63617  ORF Transcript_55728/g.63617 Transcript_55728/m.63617 type:complete len:103 (-) Transcript_55728:236-544(-)
MPDAILELNPTFRPQNHVQWSQDTVDNEGMGKKTSKICCIYEKPHDADNCPSSDSSSDSSDDDRNELDGHSYYKNLKKKAKQGGQPCNHGHSHGGHGHKHKH